MYKYNECKVFIFYYFNNSGAASSRSWDSSKLPASPALPEVVQFLGSVAQGRVKAKRHLASHANQPEDYLLKLLTPGLHG